MLVVIDERSKFIEYMMVSSAPTADDTIRLLQRISHRYGLHDWHVRMDRGKEFYNTKVSTWITSAGGKVNYSTVRRPTACGMVERVNRTLLSIMRIVKLQHREWSLSEIVNAAVEEYWTRPHTSLGGKSPREMLFDCHSLESEETYEESVIQSHSSDEDTVDEDETIANKKMEESSFIPAEETPDGDTEWKAGQKILLYEDPVEKVQFHWSPATVVQDAEINEAVHVQPQSIENGRK